MARTNAGKAAGERTRERVLDAALEIFSTQGFRGSSIDDVARRSGVGRSALLYHFRSKEGLLVALLERRDEDVILTTTGHISSESPTTDLISTIRTRSPGIRAALDAMKLAHALEAEAAEPDHPAQAWVAERFARIRSFFADHYSRDRLVAPSGQRIDPDALATVTLAVIQGLETQWLIDPESIDFDGALATYEALVLAALRPDDGSLRL